MEISISNIAWDKEIDQKIILILKQKNIKFIDIAPTKYFNNIFDVIDKDILEVRDFWNNEGINIYGMQSIFFGAKNLNIFSSESQQNFMLEYLEKILKIGNLLGSSKIVFGSPKNRNKKNLKDEFVIEVATKFFRKLSCIAESFDQTICLEPCPESYGCNFMTSTKEAAEIVRLVDREAIKLQLDTGTILLNNEDIDFLCKEYKDIVSHIHISQANLVPINWEKRRQEKIAKVIKKNFDNNVATIEMLTKDSKDLIWDISRSIELVKKLY